MAAAPQWNAPCTQRNGYGLRAHGWRILETSSSAFLLYETLGGGLLVQIQRGTWRDPLFCVLAVTRPRRRGRGARPPRRAPWRPPATRRRQRQRRRRRRRWCVPRASPAATRGRAAGRPPRHGGGRTAGACRPRWAPLPPARPRPPAPTPAAVSPPPGGGARGRQGGRVGARFCRPGGAPRPRRAAAAAQWRLSGGGTQMSFSAMWTHIRVWNLRARGHAGRFFLQSYVKRTSGAVSTLTTEGRSSSRRDASGAIKKYVLVAPES